jgi:hypothetical protein
VAQAFKDYLLTEGAAMIARVVPFDGGFENEPLVGSSVEPLLRLTA